MLDTLRLRSLLGAVALVAAAASTAAAQPERPLAARLDSLAGSGILENRAVGMVAAVVRGNGRTSAGSRGVTRSQQS
jgi:hypothetical protein